MPKPYPKEFRQDVVRVARNREPVVQLTRSGYGRVWVRCLSLS
jgi:hypothetical protein